MAVLILTTHNHQERNVLCIICLQKVPLTEVTVGSAYADDHQAFACTQHLTDRARWIVEWALFDARQREQRCMDEIAREMS